MMRAVRQRSVLIAASLTTLGCAGSAPAPRTGPEPERAPPQVVREPPGTPATTPVRASFEYAAGTATYVVTTEAAIAEIDSVASEPRVFREVARVNVTVEPATGATLVTTTGSVEGTTSAAIIQPFADTLRVDGTGTIVEPTPPICGRDTVPPMHLVTLLPPVPLELREGVRWQRRQVYAVCQGPIPMRVERTDSYVVTGRAPSGDGVTLTRGSSFAYSGSGVEGQHNVRVTGSGSGQATLILDAEAGRLLSAVEESVSEIDITASGRTRRFSQRVLRQVESR